MSGSPSADRTARLLLRYAREPSRYRTEARGPDASLVDIDVVLRLAQGRGVGSGGPTIEGADPAALRDAAMGYVREVFFRPDASPYQTLGLAPDAPQDAIKERFRLLMLLVHPDRQGSGTAWPDHCAAQANRAYGILRDPESRAAFDRQEREKAAAAKAAQQAAVAKAAALTPHPSRGPGVGRIVRRRPAPPVLPEWLTAGVGGFVREHPAGTAFGALIGVAALVVGAALWESESGSLVRSPRAPAPPPSTLEGHAARVAADAPAIASAPADAKSPVVAKALAPAAPAIAITSPEARSAGAVAAMAAHPAPAIRADEPVRAAAGRERAVPVEAPAPRPRPEPTLALAATAPPAADAAPAPAPSAASAAAPAAETEASRAEEAPVATVAANSPPAPSTAEIETFFTLFVDAYDRGRVDALAELFDDDASTNQRQGRAAIRGEYADLFRQSAWRRMQITRINWRRVGDTARARGEIAVKIGWRDGREVEQRLAVDMELARRDGRVVITRLSQQPSTP